MLTENRLEGRIERAVLLIGPGIGALELRARLGMVYDAHRCFASLLDRSIYSTGHTRQERRTQSRSLLGIRSHELDTEHIGKELPPGVARCAAAGGAHLFKL